MVPLGGGEEAGSAIRVAHKAIPIGEILTVPTPEKLPAVAPSLELR